MKRELKSSALVFLVCSCLFQGPVVPPNLLYLVDRHFGSGRIPVKPKTISAIPFER